MTASLPTRALGTTGYDITPVGFGSWATGGGGWAFGWGPQDAASSVAAIEHAVELGVNWVDTAAIYGLGHSEEVVGRALRALPADARPLIFTKCGLEWDDTDRMAAAKRIVTPHTVRHGIEDSLRRLDLDAVDLFQIHWPDAQGNEIEAAWAARHGATLAAVAVAWVLGWPGVSGAIVGARTPQQVDGWIDAARVGLAAADIDEIVAAVQATGAGDEPADPRGRTAPATAGQR